MLLTCTPERTEDLQWRALAALDPASASVLGDSRAHVGPDAHSA
ncbi:hypothetical protein [Streptomyces sp. NPDC047803]